MKKLFHKFQGISLGIAVLLLWYAPFVSHKAAMIISSIIIGLNIIPELFT